MKKIKEILKWVLTVIAVIVLSSPFIYLVYKAVSHPLYIKIVAVEVVVGSIIWLVITIADDFTDKHFSPKDNSYTNYDDVDLDDFW